MIFLAMISLLSWEARCAGEACGVGFAGVALVALLEWDIVMSNRPSEQ